MGTRDLDNSDFDDHSDHENDSHISISSTESVELVPSVRRPKTTATTAIACAVRSDTPALHRHAHGGNSLNLLSNLSQAFDPEAQRSRDAEQANHSLQNTQFLTLSQQLWDAQQATESVHNQLANVQTHLQDAERACDHAEFHLEMVQMSGSNQSLSTWASHCGKCSVPHHPSMKQKHHCKEVYPDVGGKVWWVTDDKDIESNESRDMDGYRCPPKSHQSSQSP